MLQERLARIRFQIVPSHATTRWNAVIIARNYATKESAHPAFSGYPSPVDAAGLRLPLSAIKVQKSLLNACGSVESL
jgi:hypothetical protein